MGNSRHHVRGGLIPNATFTPSPVDAASAVPTDTRGGHLASRGSRTDLTDPITVCQQFVEHVVALRQHYGWGSAARSANSRVVRTSSQEIDRIFERHDLITKKPDAPASPATQASR